MSQGLPPNPMEPLWPGTPGDPLGQSVPPQYGAGPGHPFPGVGPYGSPGGYGPPPPARSGGNTVLWVLAIVGGLSLLGCCGGVVGMVFLIGAYGKEQAEIVRKHLEADPKAVEALGSPIKVTVNYVESAEADEDHNAFDVEGPKAKGKVLADVADELELVLDCELRVNGQLVPLTEEPIDGVDAPEAPPVPSP